MRGFAFIAFILLISLYVWAVYDVYVFIPPANPLLP